MELSKPAVGQTLEDAKRNYIEFVWHEMGYDINKTINKLDISRATMYRFIDKYKLPMRQK